MVKTPSRIALTLAPLGLLAPLALATGIADAHASGTTAARTVLTQPDQRGDVWVQGEDDVWSEHGSRDNVDLTSSRVRHAPRKVVTTVRFTDLVRTTDRTTTVFWLHTSAGRTYRVQHATGPGIRGGQVVFMRYVDGKLLDRTCPGMTHAVSYADDLMRVTLPRPCLGRPAWVRFHGTATALEEGPGATYSDAMMDSGADNQLYSPRIWRG